MVRTFLVAMTLVGLALIVAGGMLASAGSFAGPMAALAGTMVSGLFGSSLYVNRKGI